MDKIKDFFQDVKNWIIVTLTGVIAWLSGVLDGLL